MLSYWQRRYGIGGRVTVSKDRLPSEPIKVKIKPAPKRVIILLDIDNTQISSQSSKKTGTIWIGGSPNVWHECLTNLKKAGAEKGITFHFGIATFKHEPAKSDVPMDSATQSVLLDLADIYGKDGLIYFTGMKSKVDHALIPAKNKIDSSMKNEDVWIVDDMQQVCDEAAKAGYRTVRMTGLSTESVEKQKVLVGKRLYKIFREYELGQSTPKMNVDTSGTYATPTSATTAVSTVVTTAEPTVNMQQGSGLTPYKLNNNMPKLESSDKELDSVSSAHNLVALFSSQPAQSTGVATTAAATTATTASVVNASVEEAAIYARADAGSMLEFNMQENADNCPRMQ